MTMATVPIDQAEGQLRDLFARVRAGEEIIIAGEDQRLRLVPEPPLQRPLRVPGRLRGQFSIHPSFYEPIGEDELRLWEGR